MFCLIKVFSCSSLQVCQFVVAVNGMNVLSLDYRTVSNLILTGPRTVVMEVMEEGEYWRRAHRRSLCFFCSSLSLDFPQWVFNGMFREVNSWFRSSFWFEFISLKSMTLICASHWLLIDCYRSMSVETLTGWIIWEKQLPNIIFSRTAAFKTLLEGRFAEPMPN